MFTHLLVHHLQRGLTRKIFLHLMVASSQYRRNRSRTSHITRAIAMQIWAVLWFVPVRIGQSLSLSSLLSTNTTTSNGAHAANTSKECFDKLKNDGKRTAYVFFNSAAGSSDAEENQAAIDTIHRILQPQIDVKLIQLDPKDPEKHCRKFLQRLPAALPESSSSSDSLPMIVAAGGDGTVAAVAKAVITAKTSINLPLGVIPRGTANAFAVALAIPTDLEGACALLLQGNTRRIDAAKSKPGNTMTLLAGLGFEANMVKTAQGRFKKWFGRLAYIWGGTKQVLAPEMFSTRVRIFLDGIEEPLELHVEAHAITVAVVAPSGSISAQGTGKVIEDDGLLDVTIQTSSTMLERLDSIMHLLGAALVNRPTDADNILKFRTRRIELRTRPRQRVVVDGELFRRRKSFVFEVLPNALDVIVPPPPPPEEAS